MKTKMFFSGRSLCVKYKNNVKKIQSNCFLSQETRGNFEWRRIYIYIILTLLYKSSNFDVNQKRTS